MRKLIICLLVLSSYTLPAQKVFITISINAPGHQGGPVRVQLRKPLSIHTSYRLYNEKTRKVIPAQLLDSLTLIFMMEEKMPVGTHTYLLEAGKKSNNISMILINKKENGLLVRIKNKPVFFYHIKEAMPPADSPAYYKRSGFIHPLYSPSGKILTDDFPIGHVHQHGIFMAWTNTTFRKSAVDFWNQHSKKGTVEHVQVLKMIQGPVVSQIQTSLRHKSVEFGEVLKEKWTITIYPSEDYFLFDLESEQQNTTKDTLFLNSYHYGGLAFRGSRQWNSEDSKNYTGAWNILTSEAKRDSSANGTHARWVDSWGRIDNGVAGATIFNHPSNFRYPQSIRVHPSMPYWAYAPVADGAFFIAPGDWYRSKFRYYIHDEQALPEVIEKLYNVWANPVSATVTYK